MKPFVVAASVTLLGTALVTEYKTDEHFRVEHETRYELELTEFDMEVDGERQDSGDRPAQKFETTWRIVQDDVVRAADGGRATQVRREFETAERRTVSTAGGEEQTDEQESPFEGLKLDLTQSGDDVRVEIVEGDAPDHEGALDGHRLDLCLDALLPKDKVDKGSSWDLDDETIRRALALDLHPALFPKKADAQEQGEGGERRGRRGRFGMSRRGERDLLAHTEWTGTATVASLTEDVDGIECAKIQLELKSSGSLPEPQPGEGRQSRMPLAAEPANPLLENTYSVELEGALYFAIGARRPVRLELEGKVEVESIREMTRSERTVRIHTKSEGELAFRIDVGEGKAESK